MPLSEFHRGTTKGKPQSNQSKMNNCSSNLSTFMPDNDFVELQWENGQVVMQGQSNRPKRTFIPTPFPSHSLKVQEKESRHSTSPKIRLFEPIDSSQVNNLSPSVLVPSANIGLHAQDDDMVPWINYSVEDPFCSDFFSEFLGTNPNSLSNDRNNGFGVKDFHNVEHGHSSIGFKEGRESCRIKSSQMFQSPQQCETSIPSSRPRVADFSAGVSGSSSINAQGQLQRPDLGSTSQLAGGVTNFSHFSRPVALAKASVDHSNWLKSTKETPTVAASTNPMDSTLIDSTGVQDTSTVDLAKRERNSVAKPHCVSLETSEPFVFDSKSRNNHHDNGTTTPEVNLHNSNFAGSVTIGRQEAEKVPEAVVASSVCSGSSAGAGSNDPKNRQKRKNWEGDDSGYQSEDLEDDSVVVKKLATARAGTTTKRSRAAEVHNLSERRRRERINEKMRALQELIPNCNKVDKASMLDEAIQYLKTLQLQVQMMSMGSGVCMSPMMLTPGMQHIRAPPIAHFSHMGVGMGMGMGMGMGYGMGMLDMKSSPGCPLIPVPPVHAPQFAGATGLHGMPGSSGLQLFGMPGHGQGITSMPHTQLFSPFAAKGNTMNEVSGTMVNMMPVLDIAPSPRCKDQQHQQQSNHSDTTQKASTSNSQVEKESLESNLLQISSQALQIGGNGAVNSIRDNANTSRMETSFG